MKPPRRALLTKGAYAVLCECNRGAPWQKPPEPQPGMVELLIASEQYDGLLKLRESLGLSTVSDVIIHLYKNGPAQ